MEENMLSIGKIAAVIVVSAIAFWASRIVKTKRERDEKPDKIAEKTTQKSSNLSELEAKFKRDYVNQKLSEYADVNGIADEIVKKVYPSYKKDLNNASIKWTEFNGAISELEERLAKFDGGGSTPQRRFVNMLSSECAPEIDALIAKIKEIK
jgi:hypothetical protein